MFTFLHYFPKESPSVHIVGMTIVEAHQVLNPQIDESLSPTYQPYGAVAHIEMSN